MKVSSRLATIGATVVAAVTLAACSPDIRHLEEQSAQSQSGQSGAQSADASGPNLDDARIRRIVGEVQTVLDRAQEENDPTILAERLTGSALAMREGQFRRADKTGQELEPLTISINVASATVGDSWPRVLLVGSEASSEAPAEVYLFTQADAQSSYMLANWVRAVGGNSVRGVAVAEGSRALEGDSEGFVLTPDETIAAYIEYLNDQDAEGLPEFDDPTFTPRYFEDLETLNTAVEAAGKVTAVARESEFETMGVDLATGEALVAGSFMYTHTYALTVEGATMTVGGTAASYLGNPDVIGTVSVSYLVNIFLTVPPEGSTTPIKVVGTERAITSVSRDDDATPEGD